MKMTAADILVTRLARHGVTHIFGYPGGQLTPIYDALYRHGGIRHILARDEQAAAFMADGYARVTGKPGVALAVSGPGVYNAATPLASAFTDSIPLLVISGQIASTGRGLRSGYYHENEQFNACETMTKYVAALSHCREIIPELDETFRYLTEGRPGSVLYSIPLDIQRIELDVQQSEVKIALEVPLDQQGSESLLETFAVNPERNAPAAPDAKALQTLADLVASWKKPLILAGGGVVTANASNELGQLADRLGAPVFHTFMGKSALSSRHRLKAGLPWKQATSDLSNMESMFSPLFAEADGLLAIGCRFTQAATGSWSLKPPPSIAQIDIDPTEIGRHYPVAAGVVADAKLALAALLAALPQKQRTPWALPQPPTERWRLPGLDLVGPLRQALPEDAIVVADITRLGYMLLSEFPVYQPRTFLHPAGFVPMGYGIPAALGAKAAHPNRLAVAVVGDGCFLMSGMELASAVQEKLPIIVILVNDSSLTLIKSIQQRRYENRFIGVDMKNPDFGMLAKAFGVRSWRVDSDAGFARAMREAVDCGETALVEVTLP
jgi:thiamine pyrophosphate-dependent acetolactate synthase large subunit-like protein